MAYFMLCCVPLSFEWMQMLKQRRLIVRLPIMALDDRQRDLNTSLLFLPRFAPNVLLQPGQRLRVRCLSELPVSNSESNIQSIVRAACPCLKRVGHLEAAASGTCWFSTILSGWHTVMLMCTASWYTLHRATALTCEGWCASQPTTSAGPGEPPFAVEDCNTDTDSLIKLLKDAGGTVAQSDLKVPGF